jgi:hypothetical protein
LLPPVFDRFLDEADNGASGAIAGLLRREGLYSSHLTTWRKLRAKGELAGLEPRKRGKKPVPRNPLAAENESLRRKAQQLEKRLHQAEVIIDVQKKTLRSTGADGSPDRAERERRMIACRELSTKVGAVAGCSSLDIALPDVITPANCRLGFDGIVFLLTL